MGTEHFAQLRQCAANDNSSAESPEEPFLNHLLRDAQSPSYLGLGEALEEIELDRLADDPSLVSQDPYGKGWLIKVKVRPGTTLDHLMTHEQYQQQLASEEH